MAMVMACICNPHRWKHFKSDHNLDSFVHFYAGPTCVRCLVRMQMYVARGLLTKSVPSFPRTETQIVSWLKDELADLVKNRLQCITIFTAHKRSFTKVMFLHLSVILSTGGCWFCLSEWWDSHHWGHITRLQHLPGADPPPNGSRHSWTYWNAYLLYTKVCLSQRHNITGRHEMFKWLETVAFAFCRVNLFSLFHSFCFKTFFEKVLVVQNVNEHKSFPWTVFKVTAVDTDDY